MSFLLQNRVQVSLCLLTLMILIVPVYSHGNRCQDIFSTKGGFVDSPSLRVSAPIEFVPTQLNEYGKVVLYRGDLKDLEYDGILSDALKDKNISRITAAMEIINNESHQDIADLILSHGDSSQPSPFVRASLNPALAQISAKGLVHRKLSRNEQTIYRIEVDPNRVVQVPLPQSLSGLRYVVLILGMVTPAEITAVKVNNSVEASELLYNDKGGELIEAKFLSELPLSQEPAHVVRDPLNWMWLKYRTYYY